jgi:hypothetical protein
MNDLSRREFIRRASSAAALPCATRIGLASESAGAAALEDQANSLPTLERAPRAQELLAYPEDGQSMSINPPGFTWTPHDNARSYLLEIRAARQGSTALQSLSAGEQTAYALSQPLKSGEYAWRVRYVGADGKPYGASRLRLFNVPPGVTLLTMPEVAVLKQRLASVRPRLFLVSYHLATIRSAVATGEITPWNEVRKLADAALEEKSYPDPILPPSVDKFAAWGEIFRPGKIASAHLARTALAYRLTSDPKYLAGARRWMMTLAGWDPRGVTSYDVRQRDGTIGIDEAAMPILERMSLAWDWMGGELTAEEGAKVLAVVRERGMQILNLLHQQNFLTHPFSNHEGRALGFLGLAGLSFLGDLPEADEWLDYVLRCYLTCYPCWGGDDGAYAQGTSYWSIYVYWLTDCLEAIHRATFVDVFRRPFYHETGYFTLYVQPPYAPRGAFGDGGDHGPSEITRVLMDRFAEKFHDPTLKWYAESIPKTSGPTERWRQWYIDDVMDVVTSRPERAKVRPSSPKGLDGSRHFSSIGWVAMHSALGDARNDVWALFKSSRFGSFSHSHGDQNTFQLNAYGQALAIDSGYYPAYGSPHDTLWTRQTRAHNGILVNGRGQPPFVWDAQGKIEVYERHGSVTVVRAQAAQAYNLPQTESTAKLWRENLKEPIPPMDPRVESFNRTVVFCASPPHPMLIVHDFLRTSAPTTFDWLLHALNPLQAHAATGTITIQQGDARLAVRLYCDQPFTFSHQTGFPIPPEKAENTAYQDFDTQFADQSHLTAHTQSPAAEIKFLAIVVPYRASEPAPSILPISSQHSLGWEVGGTEIRAWWGAGETGNAETEGFQEDCRMAITVYGQPGAWRTVICR